MQFAQARLQIKEALAGTNTAKEKGPPVADGTLSLTPDTPDALERRRRGLGINCVETSSKYLEDDPGTGAPAFTSLQNVCLPYCTLASVIQIGCALWTFRKSKREPRHAARPHALRCSTGNLFQMIPAAVVCPSAEGSVLRRAVQCPRVSLRRNTQPGCTRQCLQQAVAKLCVAGAALRTLCAAHTSRLASECRSTSCVPLDWCCSCAVLPLVCKPA